MQYRATREVNLGGGHILVEGQTVDLSAAMAKNFPGLEPVLEKVPGGATIEHHGGDRNLDAPGRGKVLRG